MDYNKFEDRISDWIENSMDIKDRKEFEKFLAENPEYQSKVDSVRNSINIMKSAPSLKTSEALIANFKTVLILLIIVKNQVLAF